MVVNIPNDLKSISFNAYFRTDSSEDFISRLQKEFLIQCFAVLQLINHRIQGMRMFQEEDKEVKGFTVLWLIVDLRDWNYEIREYTACAA